MDEERLIYEVEKFPVLYDPSDSLYKDVMKREKAWLEISATLGKDGEFFVYFTLSSCL